jgi:signal transduction histidine kinase
MSRIEELAEKRNALLSQIESLEEEHRIREFNRAKGTIDHQLRTLEQEAQGLGLKFLREPHTDCGGTLVSDANGTDFCLKCGKSGTVYSNDDRQGVMRYRFKEEWNEKGDWYKW